MLRANLPDLLVQFSKITDYRNPKKIKHKMALVLLYGILMFVYQVVSRRDANKTMTRPMFMQNLREFFPELESLPHHDTLDRVLSKIDVNKIAEIHLDLIHKFIRQKKFLRYLIDDAYPIAIDGTQKAVRRELLSEEWLRRKVGKEEDGKQQHYVYVLEANFVFKNGMVIPLMSEFLEYSKGDTSKDKQDCELRAFHRLIKRLKAAFPRLSIMILLDGLYANGPVMAACRKNNWQFMIVLKDDSLPSVWEEFNGLTQLVTNNHFERNWGNRGQQFEWINEIEYYYGPNQKKKNVVNVVVCEETWKEIDPDTCEPVTKTSRHDWISSKPLNRRNLHERCNLGARHRWGIEIGILIEKRHGYSYEHLFSHDWNSMKGFHYLMRLAHMFNVLAQYSTALIKTVQKLGLRGFFDFVKTTMAGPWLDTQRVRKRLEAPFQLRLY